MRRGWRAATVREDKHPVMDQEGRHLPEESAMHRPNKPRRERFLRPLLEVLEGRNLLGEALLTALAAAYLGEVLGDAIRDISAPQMSSI